MNKMRNSVWMMLVVFGMILTSCNKEHSSAGSGSEETSGKGTIRIAIRGEGLSSRAVGSPQQSLENTVKSFSVYVFNYASGVLEQKATFSDELEGQLTGLNVASAKRVVVLVNEPGDFPVIYSYDNLSATSSLVSLDSQVPGDFSNSGLLMSGEYDGQVVLNATETVSIAVPVARVTAKVRLGALTVTPDEGLSLDDFELLGVSIQEARDRAPVLGGLAATGFNYVGGILAAGQTGSAKSYLYESYSLPEGYTGGSRLSPQLYFYLFPNDNTDGYATLLTLYGKYKQVPMYYSFYINNKAADSGDNATDGNWIERNKVYTIQVLLKRLGNGGDDPNIPNEAVGMDVAIEVSDWEGELIQDIDW